MLELVTEIAQADAKDLECILNAVLARYREVYPDWEIITLSICTQEDRNTQIDRFIHLLMTMKSTAAE